jgi:lantibiotic modifying enzyme
VTAEVAGQAFTWIEQALGIDDDILYSGTAGVLLGCAEAAAAGLPVAGAALGRVASRCRDRLIHVAAHEAEAAAMEGDGLFDGWAGVAVGLRAWGRVAGDDPAAATATAVTERIAGRVLARPDDPDRCTDVISGDAGLLLALLDGGERGVVTQAADVLANSLVALAEDGPHGLQWRMTPSYQHLMPGFSHGTAGVAYALTVAGDALGRSDLLDVAVRAADGLLALGNRPQGWALPLLIPPQAHRPDVFFGWCHGPTGTVRLFTLLDRIGPHPRWQRAIDACLQALRDSRLPERLHPGYWDNVARCCGTAGVGQQLLNHYQATGDPALLEWAGRLAADVLSRTVRTPAGPTWSNTEHSTTPPDLPPEPNFMQGSAGIAGWLARLARPSTPALLPWL